MPLTISEEAKASHRELVATLEDAVDQYNDQVAKFNDAVFEAHGDLQSHLDDVNSAIEDLQALGSGVLASLRKQAHEQALAIDEEPFHSLLESWKTLSNMDTIDELELESLEADCLALRSRYSKKHMLPTVMYSSPTEAEEVIQQRINALEAELAELRKSREG